MCKKRGGDSAELRLTRGYVRVCLAAPDADGAKTISLARFGPYDVRLFEFEPQNPDDPAKVWLELYSHETQHVIDSCRCCDLEAAVQTTEELIAHARQLHEDSHKTNCDGQLSAGEPRVGKTGKGVRTSGILDGFKKWQCRYATKSSQS